MDAAEIRALYGSYVMPTYGPPGLVLVRGRGARVWDADGRDYLDFVAGIAVNTLGHAHPRLVQAIRRQAGRMMHVSNLYAHEGQGRLAKALVDRSLPGGRCFFCNSGAEANEGLIKLARRWGSTRGRHEVVTMCNSFHGRTLATLTATGQAKIQQGFAPLPEGFRYAAYNDLDACRAAVTDRTAAILVEAIQGEGGVLPAAPGFLEGLQALCRERDLLLMFDEVQCGMGRTGRWFGFQHDGIVPDAFSIAKGLGGGFPMGAIVAGPRLAEVFTAGSHGSTFGGTPLACAAALAVIETIEEDGLLAHAEAMGALLVERLCAMAERHACVREVRGRGLMVGLVLDRPAAPLQAALQKAGLLVIATAGNVIRFLPPLIVTPTQVRRAARLVAAQVNVYEAASEPDPG